MLYIIELIINNTVLILKPGTKINFCGNKRTIQSLAIIINK